MRVVLVSPAWMSGVIELAGEATAKSFQALVVDAGDLFDPPVAVVVGIGAVGDVDHLFVTKEADIGHDDIVGGIQGDAGVADGDDGFGGQFPRDGRFLIWLRRRALSRRVGQRSAAAPKRC